jgi:hypothetical protein
MLHWIRYFLTPGQSDTWDGGYLIWYCLTIEFIYKTWTAPTFDFLSFGTGAAGLLAAGAALQLRANHDHE